MITVELKFQEQYLIDERNAQLQVIEQLLSFSEIAYVGRLTDQRDFHYQIVMSRIPKRMIDQWIKKHISKYLVRYRVYWEVSAI